MTQIGSVIDGRYKVIDKIGEGGFSIVWLAKGARLDKRWAVKEIKKKDNAKVQKVIVESMKHEANLMKSLDNPAIPRIVDIIEDETTLFVVMDYIQGKDLSAITKEKPAGITEDDVVDWGIQLCDAMGYLHAQTPPVIYRDMKPNNVMLREDGRIQIVDFGIAKEFDPTKLSDTLVLGTEGYAAPEVYQSGGHANQVSDIYSLGATLFHLVTGHSPRMYWPHRLPSIRMINPSLSFGLDYIIAKATDFEHPEKRYQSCAEMKVDLLRYKEITPDREQNLIRKRKTFFGLAITGGVCLVLAIGLLVASTLIRTSSFDGLMEKAATADATEQNGEASEAEELYVEAIAVSPSSIEPYSELVNTVYRQDLQFSTSEESRWSKLYKENEDAISGSEDYAKLCYDAGINYYIYYDYGDETTRGSKAATWFTYAMNDYDKRTEAGQACSLTEQERRTAEVYKTIGEFSQNVSRATAEGTEGEVYAEYWDALEQACSVIEDSDPTVVKLRLYDTVMQAVNSPNYVSSFRNAGVSQSRMESLLDEVYEGTLEIEGAAADSTLTDEIYNDIVSKYETAQTNIRTVYQGSTETAGSSGDDESGSGGSGGSGGSSGGSSSGSGSSGSASSASSGSGISGSGSGSSANSNASATKDVM